VSQETSQEYQDKEHTEISIAIPANTTFAGGKALMIIVAENASGTKIATYQTDTTDDDFICRKGVKDMNGALDPLHERAIISRRGTQMLGLLLKDIEDGLDRFAGQELVEDLMLNQVGPYSILEFIESCFKERPQLWRGVDRHGDEESTS